MNFLLRKKCKKLEKYANTYNTILMARHVILLEQATQQTKFKYNSMFSCNINVYNIETKFYAVL